MAQFQHTWPPQSAILLWAPPILYFVGGMTGQLVPGRRLAICAARNLSRLASLIALFFSITFCADVLLHGPSLVRGPRLFALRAFGECRLSFHSDSVEALMLLLVAFLGWVIVSYSRSYMAGDPKERNYIRNLMQTLAAVSLLIATNNLIVFVVAWIVTSLSLHGLLTLYPERQPAVIAAHKKFLASRLGDVTLLCGVVLLGSQTGSLEMDEVLRRIAGMHPVPPPLHLAATLLALSAIIKCAQLPLHGWLIQVMEAPTPVSALLHAGVVNLGGFMLIRLAPAINTTPAAQLLLAMVGCLTAVISSLVMTTRISIKVNLAWSTCAQMGFMLMECGLGLYNLAFLHLLAHSLYKAHAFLGAGGAVQQAQLKRMSPTSMPVSMVIVIGSGCLGLLVATCGTLQWQQHSKIDPATLFCIAIAGLAIAVFLAAIPSARSIGNSLLFLASALGIIVVYFGYDKLFRSLFIVPANTLSNHRNTLIFAATCFALLYILQGSLRARPLGRFAAALYPWFYAGLYLDELFTRATFRLWPARRPREKTPLRDAAQSFEGRGVIR